MKGFSIETVSLLQVDRNAPHPQEVQLKFNVFPESVLKGRGIAVQAWFLIQLECRENALNPWEHPAGQVNPLRTPLHNGMDSLIFVLALFQS